MITAAQFSLLFDFQKTLVHWNSSRDHFWGMFMYCHVLAQRIS